jgi:hypothetical protein
MILSPTPPQPDIYQLRIVLRGVSPLVWRRLLVPCHTSLEHLHDILHIAFAWSGEHLYDFHIHESIQIEVFCPTPRKVYFRNTLLEWPGESFRKYLMCQHLSDGARIESRDINRITRHNMGQREGVCDRTQYVNATFANMLICNELNFRRVSYTIGNRLLEGHFLKSMFSTGCDLHCASSHRPSRYPNVRNGACSAPQARWPAGFFP